MRIRKWTLLLAAIAQLIAAAVQLVRAAKGGP
jgi:hypothetical protein